MVCNTLLFICLIVFPLFSFPLRIQAACAKLLCFLFFRWFLFFQFVVRKLIVMESHSNINPILSYCTKVYKKIKIKIVNLILSIKRSRTMYCRFNFHFFENVLWLCFFLILNWLNHFHYFISCRKTTVNRFVFIFSNRAIKNFI